MIPFSRARILPHLVTLPIRSLRESLLRPRAPATPHQPTFSLTFDGTPRNESAQSGPTNRQHAARMPHWTRVAARIQRAHLENAVRIRVCNCLGYSARRNRIRPRFQKDANTQSKFGGQGSKPISVVLTLSMRFARLFAKSS